MPVERMRRYWHGRTPLPPLGGGLADRGVVLSVIDGKRRGPAASSGRGAYSGVDESELVGVGTGSSHGDVDAADREADLGADFEELRADRAAGGGREPGMGQADPAQRAYQHVGERREPKAQLVGAHRRGAGAVGEEIELALLDPVLHVAASAIQLFVEAWAGQRFGFSEVTTKRGLASSRLHSALP